MNEREENDPPTNSERAGVWANRGCGCLSMASAVFLVVVGVVWRVV